MCVFCVRYLHTGGSICYGGELHVERESREKKALWFLGVRALMEVNARYLGGFKTRDTWI